ncbi:MAG: SRPBCC domain-containing protein [Thermoanaerobaculia bacterium]
MTPTALPHALDRRLLIRARPSTVFRYFTDSERWASWWGAGSTIDPVPGGRVHIRYPNAVEAGGEVVEIDAPKRIVFTMGYANGQPMPLGASRVTITLAADPAGTRLHLQHEFADAAVRDQHVQGWRYQLSIFANVASDQAQAAAAERIDAWFAAWSEPEATRREALLAGAVAAGVAFRDRFSAVDGLDDLKPHLAAVHVFMPGMRLERSGAVRHCQGTALADWIARGADGAERGRGTNVFALDADGRIADVVGLWGAPGA